MISVTHISLIACFRFPALGGCLDATLSFIIVHIFSVGLRSGLFPGHSSTEILFLFRNSVATFDRCHGAPSCMKIVQPWTCMCSFSFSLSNFMYIHSGVGETKHRQAALRYTMAHQIIWLGDCGVGFWLSKHLPNGRLMCMWRGTNCCMVHSSENNTFFLLASVQWR